MSDDTLRRVERACRDLAAERTPITFDAVAARAPAARPSTGDLNCEQLLKNTAKPPANPSPSPASTPRSTNSAPPSTPS